jgi:hypothetical protein
MFSSRTNGAAEADEDDAIEDVGVEAVAHFKVEVEGSLKFAVEEDMSLGLVRRDKLVGDIGPLKFRP